MNSTYQFYATLLDAYQDYLNAEANWEKFYGTDDPSVSLDEYVAKCERELVDKINRVPFESEAADKGTAFNEVVDRFIVGNVSRPDIDITADETFVYAQFNGYTFSFDKSLVTQLAEDYKGSIPQYLCVGVIPTQYGNVTLYGYIDELLPTEVHDIKTTGNYSAFKFRNHWQHIVYPYCLRYEGMDIHKFQYDIIKWGRKGTMEWSFYTEVYNYVPERDIPVLRAHVEGLIEFIEARHEAISDRKIFNILPGEDEAVKKYGK